MLCEVRMDCSVVRGGGVGLTIEHVIFQYPMPVIRRLSTSNDAAHHKQAVVARPGTWWALAGIAQATSLDNALPAEDAVVCGIVREPLAPLAAVAVPRAHPLLQARPPLYSTPPYQVTVFVGIA